MSRFAVRPPGVHLGPSTRPAPWALGAPAPAATAEGGAGHVGDPRHELFSVVASGLLADGFYERADEQLARVVNLTRRLAASDPDWVRGLAVWARTTAHLRSAPLVIALEYADVGAPGARQLLDAVCLRADEPGEALAYWRTYHGRSIPSRVKRGLADAVRRLYTERAVARYDGRDRAWRFGDVIEVVHPRPRDPRQAVLFRHLLDRRRHPNEPTPTALADLGHLRRFMDGTPEQRAEWRDTALLEATRGPVHRPLDRALPRALSWETLAAATPGGLDAAWWTALVLSGRLSGLALLRNLNNLDRAFGSAGVPPALASVVERRLVEAATEGRTLPYRFMTAYLASESGRWNDALERAADAALAALPELPGHTLIMVDCSGSMSESVGGGRSRQPLRRAQLAGFLAEALARRAEHGVIVTYNNSPVEALLVQPHVPVLRAAGRDAYAAGGGTSTWASTVSAFTRLTPRSDRVLVLTDEQTSDRDDGRVTCPVVTWNLSGDRVSHARHGAANRYSVHGYSDAALLTLPEVLGTHGTGRWPWETA